MLSKKQRLPIQDFLLAKATVRRSPSFTVKTFRTSLPYSRFGVVISKKVAPKATERNRIKRQIFSLLAPYAASPENPRDVLIIVQKDAMIDELRTLL